MTRIKKRRSGKKKTSDQQRSTAGRRKARSAEKAASMPKEQDVANETTKKAPSHKKKFASANAGRRGARAAEKGASAFKERRAADGVKAKKSPLEKETNAPVKATGKTRSAGSRRVAVSRSVANTFKKKVVNKTENPGKKNVPPKKTSKGFAPWSKNKFKRKDKDS